MTVQVQDTVFRYTANGVTTSFAYSCLVLAEADLVVTVNGAIVTSGFTISGIGSQTGGNVVFTTAPANLASVIVQRLVALERQTDYQQHGDWLATVVNKEFDRLWMAEQQQKEQIDRSIKIPVADGALTTELPPAVTRASKVLGFDGNGAVATYSPSSAVTDAGSVNYVPVSGPTAGISVTVQTWLDRLLTAGASLGAALVGYLQAGVGAVSRTVQDKLRETVSVKDFGAVGDGVTDDSAAIQAALSSGNVVITAPAASYRCAAGITIPAGVSFIADGFMPCNPPRGAKLIFDLAVPTCVTMGGTGSNNVSCSFKGFNVLRAAGAIPAGSIGVLNKYTYASIIEDVNIVRHAICLLLLSDGGSLGITCNMNRVFTAGATDSHVVVDTLPEARFNQCRFGMNGGGDFNCNSYIRIQGGSLTNPANGPNSIVFQNCQFNQGSNAAAAWINFANITPGTVSDLGLVQVDNCYIETSTIGITSDATWTSINRFQMSNCTYNMNSAREFVVLDAATSIDNWTISGNIFNAKFTVAPTPQINFMNVSNNIFLGAVSITGNSNSVVSFGDNTYIGGLSILGNFAQGVFQGGSTPNGSFTHTATGGVLIDISPYNLLTNWTPSLKIAGSSTGITTSVAQGTYQIIGNMVFCQISLALTSKGASVGVVTISNLPVPQLNTTVDSSGSGAIGYAVNMAGLPSLPVINVSAAGINLYVTSATGVTSLLDTNLTNTSVLRGTFSYVRAL